MYRVSQEVKNLFNKNYIQIADITVNGINGSFSIAENEIVQGSLSIDRYSVSNSKIEVGSAVAAELTLKLKNDDGKYDNTVFEGAEVFVKIGIKKWDAHRWENAVIHWIPCGYFTIDEPPRALSTITISALDRMILFDKTVDTSKLSFPMTVADLLDKICTICGVTMATDITRLPNKDYQITAYPEGQDLTYRTLLQWCAALTGTCAFMNYDGNLELKWYEQTDITISPSERYNSDMQENDVVITGIYFKDATNTEYIAGTDDYCLDLSSNGLLQDNVQVVLDTLYVSLKGFSYRPYTATIKSAPYLYPMDIIHYEDAKGEVHDTIVTNVTFGMNLSTSIAGKGETTQKQKYSQSGGLTKQQVTILEKLRENLNKTITAKEQAQLELNRLLGSSLGLNIVAIPQDDGTQIYYFCDGKTLSDSNIIYTFKSNGFAWTKDWNNGNPIWSYGFSKDGNAIFNILSAYKITSEYIETNTITSKNLALECIDSIRMISNKIMWESDNSSMTEDGTLKCSNAEIKGTIQVGGTNNKDGLIEIYDESGNLKSILDKSGIRHYDNGNSIPYHYRVEHCEVVIDESDFTGGGTTVCKANMEYFLYAEELLSEDFIKYWRVYGTDAMQLTASIKNISSPGTPSANGIYALATWAVKGIDIYWDDMHNLCMSISIECSYVNYGFNNITPRYLPPKSVTVAIDAIY